MTTGTALDWSRRRVFSHPQFTEVPASRRTSTISVCLPAREEAATITPIVRALAGLRDRAAIDEVVVLDASSRDGTAALAAEAGATVHDQQALRPELGPVRGKGDAMWRALSVLGGDIVCFLDADTEGFEAHFVTGLLGPLLEDEDIHFVKGAYRRPFKAAGAEMDEGGGRVNELMARPLLNRFFPDLAAIRQPLAGEVAARRSLLDRLPFVTGYGVDVALLIDTYRGVGLDGIAEVDLGVRQNRHQTLSELGPMAAAVLGAVTSRLQEEGRIRDAGGDSFLAAAGSRLEAQELSLVQRPPREPAVRGADAPAARGPLVPAGVR